MSIQATPPAGGIYAITQAGQSTRKNLRLVRLPIFRTAIFLACFMFLMGFPAVGVIHFFGRFASQPQSFPLLALVVVPLAFSVVGLFFGLLGSASYNVLAKLFGGLPLVFSAEKFEE